LGEPPTSGQDSAAAIARCPVVSIFRRFTLAEITVATGSSPFTLSNRGSTPDPAEVARNLARVSHGARDDGGSPVTGEAKTPAMQGFR